MTYNIQLNDHSELALLQPFHPLLHNWFSLILWNVHAAQDPLTLVPDHSDITILRLYQEFLHLHVQEVAQCFLVYNVTFVFSFSLLLLNDNRICPHQWFLSWFKNIYVVLLLCVNELNILFFHFQIISKFFKHVLDCFVNLRYDVLDLLGSHLDSKLFFFLFFFVLSFLQFFHFCLFLFCHILSLYFYFGLWNFLNFIHIFPSVHKKWILLFRFLDNLFFQGSMNFLGFSNFRSLYNHLKLYLFRFNCFWLFNFFLLFFY